MTESFIDLPIQSRIFSWIIFLFPSLALTTHFGIGAIEVAVLLGTVVYLKPLARRQAVDLRPARWIVIAFAFSLMVALVSSLAFGFKSSSVDNPVRQFLALTAIGLIVLWRPRAEWFWYGLFAGVAGAAAIALVQRFGLNFDRANGFHQTIMFGDISMAMGLMSLAGLQLFAGTRLAPLPYVAFLAGLTASILSGSRGGWLALVLSFIPLYSYGRRAIGRRILLVAATGLSLLVAACFIPQLKVGARIAEAVADVRQYQSGDPQTSAGLRLEMWKGAWKMFAEHPLAGVGRSNFNPGLRDLIVRKELHPAVADFYHAHNEMLHALATEGIIGGIALFGLYAAPFAFFIRGLRRRDETQPYALAGLLLVLSFIDFGLTQVLFSHHVGTGFYALGIAILAGICIMKQRAQP